MILSWAILFGRSVPVEGRAREASQCGSRHGPVVRPRKRHRQEAQDAWAGSRDGFEAPVEQTDHALRRCPSLPLLNAETNRARRGISALPSSHHIIEPG